MTPQRAARARLTTFRVVVLGLVGLFFLVPLVSMLDFSTRNFRGEGRTGAAWTALVTDPQLTGAIVTSLVLAVLTIGSKTLSGYLSARRAGIGIPGRWRTGLTLTPRGEFSIVIAGLAVGAGVQPLLAPLATAYVLITVIAGPLLARIPDAAWFKATVRNRRIAAEQRAAA